MLTLNLDGDKIVDLATKIHDSLVVMAGEKEFSFEEAIAAIFYLKEKLISETKLPPEAVTMLETVVRSLDDGGVKNISTYIDDGNRNIH